MKLLPLLANLSFGKYSLKLEAAYGFQLLLMRQQIYRTKLMSISICYVDAKYEIHKDTIGLIQLPNTTAQSLFAVLKDVLLRCSLPITQCVGQAYDGVANMSGIWKGVQASGA